MVDEMKLNFSSKLMMTMISKLVSGIIYKNFGYKVIVSLEDLNVNFEDGDTTIKTKVELKMDKEEYIKVIKKVDRF